MENGLFRKKSIDRISSPEALHDYMRVTSPRLWMILAALVLLLAGLIVFASTTKMENTMPIRVELQRFHEDADPETNKAARDIIFVDASLPIDQLDVIKTGMKMRLGKEEGHVYLISTSEADQTVNIVFEMDHAFIPMDDGEYDAELVLETTTPINFLWN